MVDDYELEDDESLSEDEFKELVDKKSSDKLTRKRLIVPDKKKMRNLVQYSKMPEDEFNDLYAKKLLGVERNQEFESRIQRKIKEFGADYDLDDLNSNDRIILRALAQAMLTLEDYEIMTYNIRSEEGVSIDNIMVLDKISSMMGGLRKDISKLQDDLNITRRVRKSDKDVSVISYLEDLKKKAKEFYSEKMSYIFCPTCGELLGTIWTLYPDESKNKITLLCSRKNGDIVCGTKFTVTTKELIEKRGTNNENIPESMK